MSRNLINNWFKNHIKHTYNLNYSEGMYSSFRTWAFGPKQNDLRTDDLIKQWNKRHSDIFDIDDDVIHQDVIYKMIDFWMEAQ